MIRRSLTTRFAAASLARWMLDNGTPDMWARLLIEPVPRVRLGERIRAHAGTALYRSRCWLIDGWRRVAWLLASQRRRDRLTARDLDRFLARHPQCATAVRAQLNEPATG
ncbi:hypothetical protein [Kitasatospora sp. NPDC047058]|uniref:hypothetical protein n=1 Tax=Kitasatospora sp. NPDC047058 TaxID=3155620 RepID=UPI0034088F3B